MLVASATILRKLARQKAKRQRRLNRDRREHLIGRCAETMKAAHVTGKAPTLLTLEGPLRHGIRSALCMSGWAWQEAEDEAESIVSAAIRRIGAVRPTWKQGQPEWTQEGHAPIERTRCVRCGHKLPPEHTLFCSLHCKQSHHSWLYAKDHRIELAAYQRAYRAAQREKEGR